MNKGQYWKLMAISALWVFCTVVYVFFIFKDVNNHFRDAIQFLIGSLGALGVIATILFSTFSANNLAKQREDDRDVERAVRSFELLEAWNSELFKPARGLVRKYYLNSSTANQYEFAQELESSSDLEFSFASLLNYFCSFQGYIEHKLVNEEILRSSFSNTFIRMYEVAKPWVTAHVPLQNEPLQWLHMRWFEPVSQVFGPLSTYGTDAKVASAASVATLSKQQS